MIKSELDLEVVEVKTPLTIDSREVAEMTGKRHDNLIKDIRGYAKVLDDSSNLRSPNFFVESTYINSQNKTQPCFLLTRKGCDMVANKMTGEKGILFTAEYVTKFEEMETQIKLAFTDSYMIADPIARAEKWIQEETERQCLRAISAEQQDIIGQLQPKAAFADAMNASTHCILIRELAKILKQNGASVGEKKLFAKLRQDGYLIRNELASDYNTPTQTAMNLKIFEIKRTTIASSSGSTRVSVTTKVTPKGVKYFVDKFLAGKMVFN